MPTQATTKKHQRPTEHNDHHDDGFPLVESLKDGRADFEQDVFGRSQRVA